MPEHAHDEPESRPEPPRLRPSRPCVAAIVEREEAILEAEGRTMSDWLDRIVPIPAMEPGWATAAVRERRDSDDIPKPSMKDVLWDMDHYRRPDGPTSEEIVQTLHEDRQERDEQLNDAAAHGAAPRTPRAPHQ